MIASLLARVADCAFAPFLRRGVEFLAVGLVLAGLASCSAVPSSTTRKAEQTLDEFREAIDEIKHAIREVIDEMEEEAGSLANKGITLQPPPLGSVHGRITDEAGNSLADATVSVGDSTVQTTVDGTYMVRDVPKGSYTKVIQMKGFKEVVEIVKVKPQEQTENNAKLVPDGSGGSASIRGTIRSASSGHPIEGASVGVLGAPERVRSAADGTYEIRRADHGTRCIVAEAEGYVRAAVNRDLAAGDNQVDIALMTPLEEWQAEVRENAERVARAQRELEACAQAPDGERQRQLDCALQELQTALYELVSLREDASRLTGK